MSAIYTKPTLSWLSRLWNRITWFKPAPVKDDEPETMLYCHHVRQEDGSYTIISERIPVGGNQRESPSNWYPDWDLDFEDRLISSPDKQYESLFHTRVFEENPGSFRIYSNPGADSLNFGDLIEGYRCGDELLQFTGVIEESPYVGEHSILSNPYDSVEFDNHLTELAGPHGYWQVTMGGMVAIYRRREAGGDDES